MRPLALGFHSRWRRVLKVTSIAKHHKPFNDLVADLVGSVHSKHTVHTHLAGHGTNTQRMGTGFAVNETTTAVPEVISMDAFAHHTRDLNRRPNGFRESTLLSGRQPVPFLRGRPMRCTAGWFIQGRIRRKRSDRHRFGATL